MSFEYAKKYGKGTKCPKCGKEMELDDIDYRLKQFAERLKEKFYYEGRICRYIIDSDVFDETLKEFINE